MTTKIPKTIGDYRIVNLIAEPGLSEIYLGHHKNVDPDWENFVTVKRSKSEYREEMREYIRNEVKVLSRLSSVYTPKIVDWDEEKEEYLVLEYSIGNSLDKITRMKHSELIDLSLELAEAINYLHSQGVVHRDLKPDNVLIGDKVTLIDFSIACIWGQPVIEAYGTPGYSPIELKKGLCNPEIDIYGLGATMFALLTGRNPITTERLIETNFFHLVHYILTRKNPLMEILESYDERDILPKIISECLRHDRAARPNIANVITRLKELETKPRIFVQGQTHFLRKSQITLGASTDCDIRIESPWQCIDDTHAIIYKEGDSWYFLDNSQSGSFLVESNEFRRVHELELYNGSYLALGYSESKGHHISIRFRA